ncbi:MAG TPA: hypothetical protein VD886_22700, partial [Herpetosiphonaceae bacterium]|nr:hypothetical protein [Herpetosiphonaceae bacterium]
MKKGIFLTMIGLMALCVELRLNGIELVPDIAGAALFAVGLFALRRQSAHFTAPLIASGVFAAISAISLGVTLVDGGAVEAISINTRLTAEPLALARLAALVAMLWLFCDAVFKLV